jgi:Protein of unknown function (DUF3025)
MLPDINWDRPWLAPCRTHGAAVAKRLAGGSALCTALNGSGSAPFRFVAQSALPAGQPYEQFIFETRTVPTRDNLHDFFNGLCWITFPRTKTKLNELQAQEIARAGVQPVRGPVRDALTVFDENAAFLVAPQPLWDALEARDWKKLFVSLRPLWNEAQVVIFGHALLEKLIYPRKAITAHVFRAQPAIDSIADLALLDAWIANDINSGKLAGKPFLPLPVLGVPGWWSENENFSFYDDSSVFRIPAAHPPPVFRPVE